jgi:hypothetical protein
MEARRNPRTLIRWSGALAACGALIFIAAVCFLATALWHHSLISGYGPTYILAPPALIACFVVSSIVVLAASTFVRHIADHRFVALAKRLSPMAIIGTVAGWLTVGVMVLLLAHR